jgi:hypothetical protein
MSFLLPWFATFAFGIAVFLIGKQLQNNEKKRKLKRKVAEEAAGAQAQAHAQLSLEAVRLSGFLASMGTSEDVPRKQQDQKSKVALLQ